MTIRLASTILSCLGLAAAAPCQGAGCSSASFSPPESHPAINAGSKIGIGDFNGDGHQDLVVSSNTQLALLAGDSTGGFGMPVVIAGAPAAIMDLVVGDFNEDGLSDLATASQFDANVQLYVGDVAAGLVVAGQLVNTGTITSITVGEVNGDSHLDLVVTRRSPRYVVVHQGTGDAWTSPSSAYQYWTFNYDIAGSVVGNFNGDAYPDLVVVEQLSPTARCYEGRPNGTLNPTWVNLTIGTLPGLFLTHDIVASDFDQNGIDDVAVLRGQGLTGRLSVALAQGSGLFAAPIHLNVSAAPQSLATADLNRDGNPDMVVTYGSGSPRVLLGNGTGGFASSLAQPLANASVSVAAGDLDDNESIDLAFPSATGATVDILRNSCASPQFFAPTPCGQVLNASVGVPLSFVVSAGTSTGSSLVLDIVTPLPGIMHSPALPATGVTGSVATTFSWTPTNGDVGTHVLQYTATADGFTRNCSITIQIAECYLLIGSSAANQPLGWGDVLLTSIDWYASVTTAQIPTFQIPSVPAMAGTAFYAQVAMFNPTVFPGDPLQLTNGLRVVLGQGSSPYGSGGSAMQLVMPMAPMLGATVTFAFSVPGM